MKKIIPVILLMAISVFANGLSAQEISKDQMRIFQTDHLQNFKKAFKKEDYNKCFVIKENSYDLLSLSIKHQRKNNFDFLLNNTTDINRLCNNASPLMIAAKYGRAEMIKELVKKGADKSLKNVNGETAKDFAVKNNHAELASIL